MPVQRRAGDLAAAAAGPRGRSVGAHLAQRHGDPVDRAAADRVVAVERPARPLLPGQPARQQPQQGAGVADVDRAPGRRPRRPTPATRIIGSIAAVAPTPLDPRAERPRPRPGSSACRRRRGSPRSSSPPPPSPRSAPPGGRSTCRRAGAGSRAAGRAESKRVIGATGYSPGAEHGDRVAEAADQRRRALGLLVAGDPERDRAGAHVGGRVERHVLDVDPGLAQRQGQLGDRAGPVGDDDPQLVQRAGLALGLEQRGRGPRRRRRARRRPPRGRRARISAAASSRRRATDSTESATASRLLAKMSAQIAGLEPATRVVSRKLGPTSGIRSESPLSAAAASAARALATTCGRWLTVAIRRSWRAGVDRLRAGAEAGDGALQAVVEDAAGALCRGQVPAGALEEVRAGVLDPGGLGAGQRVAADEALVAAERGDQLALGRADVGDHGLRAAGRQRRARLLGQRRHRAGAEDELGALAGLRDRAGGAVERAQLDAPARSVAGLRPKPTTSASSRRRAASPIEPPIRPTPRTATSGPATAQAAASLDRRGEPIERRRRCPPSRCRGR